MQRPKQSEGKQKTNKIMEEKFEALKQAVIAIQSDDEARKSINIFLVASKKVDNEKEVVIGALTGKGSDLTHLLAEQLAKEEGLYVVTRDAVLPVMVQKTFREATLSCLQNR